MTVVFTATCRHRQETKEVKSTSGTGVEVLVLVLGTQNAADRHGRGREEQG